VTGASKEDDVANECQLIRAVLWGLRTTPQAPCAGGHNVCSGARRTLVHGTSPRTSFLVPTGERETWIAFLCCSMVSYSDDDGPP